MNEKILFSASGYKALIYWLGGMILAFVIGVSSGGSPAAAILSILLIAVGLVSLVGFVVINPNEARVFTFLGEYMGSVKESGFLWVNPFYGKTKLSLRMRNLETDKVKVNDRLGNPIVIASVVVWKVADTAKAKFEVDNYEQFVKLQCDSAVRHLAGKYSYDHFEDEHSEITLRSGGDHINEELEKELQERLNKAGVQVVEARITHLVYAEEIAHAMLQRQQATAMVAARQKIVEGAVGMVDMALKKLSEEQIVVLDEERKAQMVSNLLVVLCSDKAASPVVNTGSLY